MNNTVWYCLACAALLVVSFASDGDWVALVLGLCNGGLAVYNADRYVDPHVENNPPW